MLRSQPPGCSEPSVLEQPGLLNVVNVGQPACGLTSQKDETLSGRCNSEYGSFAEHILTPHIQTHLGKDTFSLKSKRDVKTADTSSILNMLYFNNLESFEFRAKTR